MLATKFKLILRLLNTSAPSIVKVNLNVSKYVLANTTLVGYKYTIDCESSQNVSDYVKGNTLLVGYKYAIDC